MGRLASEWLLKVLVGVGVGAGAGVVAATAGDTSGAGAGPGAGAAVPAVCVACDDTGSGVRGVAGADTLAYVFLQMQL